MWCICPVTAFGISAVVQLGCMSCSRACYRANLGEVNKTVHKSREMFKASKLFENVDVTIHKTSYQNSKAAWRTCAHLRLAIPNIHKEAGIYVDVDTRVRGNICHANAVLKSLNASVWAALTTEDGDWYKDGNTEGPF